MKEITIEWMHYRKEGETCTRCNDTGANIQTAITTIKEDPKFKGIVISFIETKLGASGMPDSNTVLINSRKLEDILEATSSENFCHSCSCLAGKGTNCRTVKYKDKVYEEISEELIIKAIEKIQR